MVIKNFILDLTQQSNYGIKGQVLPRHLLSGTDDTAQQDKQGDEGPGTGYEPRRTHTVPPSVYSPNTDVKNRRKGGSPEFNVQPRPLPSDALPRDRTR